MGLLKAEGGGLEAGRVVGGGGGGVGEGGVEMSAGKQQEFRRQSVPLLPTGGPQEEKKMP